MAKKAELSLCSGIAVLTSAHHKLARSTPSRSFMFLNCGVLLLWRHPFPLAVPRAHSGALGGARRGRGGSRGTHTHTNNQLFPQCVEEYAKAASYGNDLP